MRYQWVGVVVVVITVLAAPLRAQEPDAELYFQINAAPERDGEIRFDVRGHAADPSGSDTATAIPLPPALLVGLLGLGTTAWAVRRRKSITR